MTQLQTQAFRLASKTLDKSSRFYSDDLNSLKACYSKKTASQCKEAISRFTAAAAVTKKEISSHFDDRGFWSN